MKITKLIALLVGALTIMTLSSMTLQAEEQKAGKEVLKVSKGSTVKVHYTLTVDGKVVDNSEKRKPLEFKMGSKQIIPGFEKAVMGMKVGERKSFSLSPEEGYGRKNPDAVREISRDKLPPDVEPKAGMKLFSKGKGRNRRPIRIKEVKEDTVILDFNHPLAGKTLNFDVEIIEIM